MAPPKRRRTSGPTSSTPKQFQQQSTLSFNRTRSTANKVTKPNLSPGTSDLRSLHTQKSQDELLKKPELTEQSKPSAHAEVGDAKADEVDQGEEEELDEDVDEAAASKISQTQIRQYWAARERARKAPRVHQQGLDLSEKLLREFDMTSRYGPSMGMTRLHRWKRARNLGMQPPLEVLAVLLRSNDGKSEAEGHQRSIMDELVMSTRSGGGKDVAAEA